MATNESESEVRKAANALLMLAEGRPIVPTVRSALERQLAQQLAQKAMQDANLHGSNRSNLSQRSTPSVVALPSSVLTSTAASVISKARTHLPQARTTIAPRPVHSRPANRISDSISDIAECSSAPSSASMGDITDESSSSTGRPIWMSVPTQPTKEPAYASAFDDLPPAMHNIDKKKCAALRSRWEKILLDLGFTPHVFPASHLKTPTGYLPHKGSPKQRHLNFLIYFLLAKHPMKLDTIFNLLIAWKGDGNGITNNSSVRHSLTTNDEFHNRGDSYWVIATCEEAKEKEQIAKAKKDAQEGDRASIASYNAADASPFTPSIASVADQDIHEKKDISPPPLNNYVQPEGKPRSKGKGRAMDINESNGIGIAGRSMSGPLPVEMEKRKVNRLLSDIDTQGESHSDDKRKGNATVLDEDTSKLYVLAVFEEAQRQRANIEAKEHIANFHIASALYIQLSTLSCEKHACGRDEGLNRFEELIEMKPCELHNQIKTRMKTMRLDRGENGLWFQLNNFVHLLEESLEDVENSNPTRETTGSVSDTKEADDKELKTVIELYHPCEQRQFHWEDRLVTSRTFFSELLALLSKSTSHQPGFWSDGDMRNELTRQREGRTATANKAKRKEVEEHAEQQKESLKRRATEPEQSLETWT